MGPKRQTRALLVGALLFGCTEATPPPQAVPPKATATAMASALASATVKGPCVLSGRVTSDSGAPVDNALVAAVPPGGEEPAAIARSDREGQYCFSSLDVGSYGFTITAPGLTAAYLDVSEVAPRGMNQAKLGFQVGGPGFVLRGLVADDKGAPIPGARVYITRSSNFMADTFLVEAGPDGRYEAKLPAGDYRPATRSERYASSATSLELGADSTFDITAQRLNPRATPAPDEVVAWIKGKAVPLKTVEAGNGLDDMEPLRAVVGGARLVALGEATHGSREFFQLKHRMLEFLVEKMGFRSFGIEASFGDCLPLSEYVRTGKGDPAAALANQGFWTWDTEEVLALVKWMRAYNEDKAHKDKLSFWGFDMQSAAGSALALRAYFDKVDPDFGKAINDGLGEIDDDFAAGWLDQRAPADRKGTAEFAQLVAKRFDGYGAAYVKKSSERELALARIHAQVLVDATLMASTGQGGIRDRSMADIATALLHVEDLAASAKGAAGGAGAKMVLWAHNGHIGKHDNGGPPSMGSFLAKKLGTDYVAFGFSFDEGAFQAVDIGKDHRGVVPFAVPSAPPGSLDHTLARAGIPLLALDLRGAPAGPVADWLSTASYTRSVGALFADNTPDYGLEVLVPTQHFDALLFVQKTTAAHPKLTAFRGGDGDKKAPPAALADPGFEAGKNGEVPAGWRIRPTPGQLEYRAVTKEGGCASGKRCLLVERTKGDVPTGYGSASTGIDATPFRGRKVRVSASVRYESKAHGARAYLVVATGGDKAGSVRAGKVWTKKEVEVDVPADATRIGIGLTVTGAAKGWIDDIEVSAIDKK